MINRIENLAFTLVRLGELALQFGRVDRITAHPDGIIPESDTDHTVMLGWLACALAAKLYPQLDLGLVAQYALVHDAPEVYAGDTPTLRISADEQIAKDEREHHALRLLHSEFSDRAPWFPETISSYEAQLSPEARFVKGLDKVLPQVTDVLNNGDLIDMESGEFRGILDRQREQMATYLVEFPEVLALHELMTTSVCACLDDAAKTEEFASERG